MADEIDYDALDQALRGAIRHEKQPKVTSSKKTSDDIKPKPTPAPKPKVKPNSVPVKRRPAAPRGHYMDMVSSSRAANAHTRPRPVAPKPKAHHPAKPKPKAPAPAGPTLAAPPATQAVPLVPIAYTQDGTPVALYTQPNTPQIAQPVPTPAPQKPTPPPAVPPQEPTLPAEPAPAPAPAPVAEETPLGARSPYMVNTQVDKRPLGNDAKEGINQLYGNPEPTAQASKEEAKSQKSKKEKKESSFDWKWILTMIIVVIAGAIAGYLFYILFADKLPF